MAVGIVYHETTSRRSEERSVGKVQMASDGRRQESRDSPIDAAPRRGGGREGRMREYVQLVVRKFVRR